MARKSSRKSNARGSSADEVVSFVFSVLVALAMLFGAAMSGDKDKTAKKATLVAIVVLVVLVQLYDLAK